MSGTAVSTIITRKWKISNAYAWKDKLMEKQETFSLKDIGFP
jgi:hypothetical protein